MRSRLMAAVILCAVAALLIAQTPQQQEPPPFLTLNFYKVAPDKVEAYEEFVASMTRKLMQAVVDSGDSRRWVQMKMVSPAGSNAEYNYIAAMTWKGAPRLDMSRAETDPLYARAGINRAGYMDRARSIGATLVKREVWTGPLAMAGERASVGDFLRVDYKHVTASQEYVKTEREVYQAIWAERVKQNTLKGWAVYFITQPGGMDRPVSFATVQSFKDETQLFTGMRGAPSFADTFKQAHPGKDMDEVMKKAAETNKTVRMEIARIRHIVTPAATTSGTH